MFQSLFKKKTLFLLPLISLLFFTSPISRAADKFHFVVWGDSQFENPEVFERFVEWTELLQPSFVLQVGDLIHGYTYDEGAVRVQWERYFEQVEPLSAPIYPSTGNHDVTTAEIAPVFKEVWGLDDYHYSFTKYNSLFLALDTCEDQEFNTLSERQVDWVKEELRKHEDVEHIFLYFHHPIYFKEDHEGSVSPFDWDSFHEYLLDYPVTAIFSGHSHVYDYQVRDGIHYFCLNTSGRLTYYNHLAGYSHHILYVTVKGDAVHFAVIEKDGIYKPDAAAPYEWLYSRDYFRDEQTILIPNPEEDPGEHTAHVNLVNEAPESRNFTLTWHTDDYRWNFSPWGKNIQVPAESEKTFEFVLNIPEDAFERHELPYLVASSPYTTLNGHQTHSDVKYRLFSPPATQAIPTEEPIYLDGILDEDIWQKAPKIDTLYTDKTGTPAAEKTIVRILYDDKNIYVGIWGEEPNPEGLAAHAYGEIPLVFADDDFELYFDTNRDLDTFHRLMVNPAETVLCSNPDGLFTFEFDVATHIGEDYWSAEFQIPYAELDTSPPQPGDEWGFNVRRHRQQGVPAQSDWVKMRNFPYQPPYFGLLQFK